MPLKAKKKVAYLIGSLRNDQVPHVAKQIREAFPEWEVFDDWFSPGPAADDYWRDYCKVRGQSYIEALDGWAGKHVFEFDHAHIDRADIGILLMPAGKSGHLELGYMIGQGKPCFYVMEEGIERWDVMLQFCNLNDGAICADNDDLIAKLKERF